jgi:hypothetical protein
MRRLPSTITAGPDVVLIMTGGTTGAGASVIEAVHGSNEKVIGSSALLVRRRGRPCVRGVIPLRHQAAGAVDGGGDGHGLADGAAAGAGGADGW